MSGRLLVVGSVNHDLVVAVERLPAPGETVLGAELEEHEGGKGANAATAAARLGAAVAMVGAVGAEERGDGALAALTAAGVDVALVERRDDAPTGVAVVAVDGAGENQIVVAPGANATVTAAQVERALEERAGAVDAVLVSCEVPDEAVAAAVRGAHARGLRCVLNPAPARPSLLELARWAPLLTPNRAEAAALAGEEDAEAAATALAGRTGAPVVVTLGEDGALLVGAGRGAALPRPGGPRARHDGRGRRVQRRARRPAGARGRAGRRRRLRGRRRGLLRRDARRPGAARPRGGGARAGLAAGAALGGDQQHAAPGAEPRRRARRPRAPATAGGAGRRAGPRRTRRS